MEKAVSILLLFKMDTIKKYFESVPKKSTQSDVYGRSLKRKLMALDADAPINEKTPVCTNSDLGQQEDFERKIQEKVSSLVLCVLYDWISKSKSTFTGHDNCITSIGNRDAESKER